MLTIIIVPVEGPVREEQWESAELCDKLAQVVDGLFDVVSLSQTVDMWVSDDGIIRGMPLNRRATNVARLHGMLHQGYYGPAVFTGGCDLEGATESLSVHDRDIIRLTAVEGVVLVEFDPVSRTVAVG